MGCGVGGGVGLDVAMKDGTRAVSPEAVLGTWGIGIKHADNKNASPKGASVKIDIRLVRILFKRISEPYKQ